MKFITKHKYDSDYLGKVDKSRVFFNPDNSVAIFEDHDEEILKWVCENAAKLKQNGFYLTKETSQQLREHVKEKPKSAAKGEVDGPVATKLKDEKLAEQTARESEKAAILKDLAESPSIKDIREIILPRIIALL